MSCRPPAPSRAWRGVCTGVALGLVLDAGLLWGAGLLWRVLQG